LKKAVAEAKDAETIKKKIEELNNSLQKASTELYQKAAQEQQATKTDSTHQKMKM
jgi:tetrahydromethanopterin S-methyltransferase subunit G